MTPISTWTEERVEALHRLHAMTRANGKPVFDRKTLAARLGVTLQSLIARLGREYRTGTLTVRDRTASLRSKRRYTLAEARCQSLALLGIDPPPAKQPRGRPPKTQDAGSQVSPLPRAPLPLEFFARPRGCLWPMWPHHERPPRPPIFCNAPVRAGSFCAAHAAIAWIKPRHAERLACE